VRFTKREASVDSIEGKIFTHLRSYDFSLDSALMRQALYTTTRLGIYFSLSDYLKYSVNGGANMTGFQKIYSSLLAGGIGSMVGTPADLVLIRMQSDSTLPLEKRRNYKNFFDAFSRIVREEGPLACWKGCTPTVVRAMALNLGMLSSYDESKERLEKILGKDKANTIWVLSSLISGGIAATMSLPFDNVKTKMQKMTRNPDGTMPYKSLLDCAYKSVRNESVLGLWVGLPTYIVRIAPHVMIVSNS
jgi:solute carrier family 25 oxoglutarate transporter 11